MSDAAIPLRRPPRPLRLPHPVAYAERGDEVDEALDRWGRRVAAPVTGRIARLRVLPRLHTCTAHLYAHPMSRQAGSMTCQVPPPHCACPGRCTGASGHLSAQSQRVHSRSASRTTQKYTCLFSLIFLIALDIF